MSVRLASASEEGREIDVSLKSQPRTDLEPCAPIARLPRDEMHYGADSDDPYEASMERYHGMPREVDLS